MPQITSFTLADRAATPVNHTFVPAGESNGVVTSVERGSTALENKKITQSNREVKRAGGAKYKGRYTITVPIVQTQTVNGISMPVVVRTHRVDFNVEIDGGGTDQEIKDILGFAYGKLAPTAQFATAIVNRESFW